MSTEIELNKPFGIVPLSDVTKLLIKQNNIHEGLFDLAFEITVTVGTLGASKGDAFPGVLSQIKAVGLIRTEDRKEITVDAAECNPKKSNVKKSKND